MESEPDDTNAENIDRENMTIVYLGNVAVWVTVWEYYAKYNT